MFRSSKAKKQEVSVLLRPPLLEAIFELRWELEQNQATGTLRDPSYPMMYGRIYEKLKEELPIIEDLPTTQVHPESNPFVVRHRMRANKEEWPLIQVGPGVLTVNETQNYSWTAFRSLIARSIEAIQETFPTDGIPLNFIKAEIRYVNGIFLEDQTENPLSFLAEKLHTKIELDPEIFELNDVSDYPIGLGLNLLYPLQNPRGQLGMSMNMGQVDRKPAYIVQFVIHAVGESVPQDLDSFLSWLNRSHEIAENCFQTVCKGSLMSRFASL